MRALRGEKCCPVVKLRDEPMKTKFGGSGKRPHFEIIGWKAPGDGLAQALPAPSTPQLSGPSTARNQRQRVSTVSFAGRGTAAASDSGPGNEAGERQASGDAVGLHQSGHDRAPPNPGMTDVTPTPPRSVGQLLDGLSWDQQYAVTARIVEGDQIALRICDRGAQTCEHSYGI